MTLVSHPRYAAITGDTDSAETPVAEALADAQALLEDELGRGLESAERTERLRIHHGAGFPGGRVYPSVTPVTVAADHTLVGTAALDGVSPSSGPFGTIEDAYADVTYTGGYTAENVPACIARDIAWAAYRLVHADAVSAVPAGAKSVRMGDASVTFDRATTGGDSVGWSRATLRYRRRRV